VTAVDLAVDCEGLSEGRPDAKHVEEPRRHTVPHEIFGLAAHCLKCELTEIGNGSHRLEYLLLGGPVDVVLRLHSRKSLRIAAVQTGANGDFASLPGDRALADRHELIGLVKRQAAEHNSVHHREDGRTGTDAERQDEQRDDGKAGIFSKHSESVTKVVVHSG
jgi:hypothetical protein